MMLAHLGGLLEWDNFAKKEGIARSLLGPKSIILNTILNNTGYKLFPFWWPVTKLL